MFKRSPHVSGNNNALVRMICNYKREIAAIIFLSTPSDKSFDLQVRSVCKEYAHSWQVKSLHYGDTFFRYNVNCIYTLFNIVDYLKLNFRILERTFLRISTEWKKSFERSLVKREFPSMGDTSWIHAVRGVSGHRNRVECKGNFWASGYWLWQWCKSTPISWREYKVNFMFQLDPSITLIITFTNSRCSAKSSELIPRRT